MNATPLPHGGRLLRAAARSGIAPERWLDLSTGLNPTPWPVPPVPPEVWQRLPEDEDGLLPVARAWAGVPEAAGCVALPGSQAAIQLLPRLRPTGRVGVPTPGYAEHGWWWAQAGHEVEALAHDRVDQALDHLDVLVWIHPNNPTGTRLPLSTLREWHRRLAARGGWLVLDEAFIDTTPKFSLAADAGAPGLVLLRSTGKFFGLAGLRGGFAFAAPSLCMGLEHLLGPWALSHPARWVLARALADRDWQQGARTHLRARRAALDAVLARHGLSPEGGTELFAWCPHPDAMRIADALTRHAVLVRVFTQPSALRFGLPADEAAERRLDLALADAMAEGSVTREAACGR